MSSVENLGTSSLSFFSRKRHQMSRVPTAVGGLVNTMAHLVQKNKNTARNGQGKKQSSNKIHRSTPTNELRKDTLSSALNKEPKIPLSAVLPTRRLLLLRNVAISWRSCPCYLCSPKLHTNTTKLWSSPSGLSTIWKYGRITTKFWKVCFWARKAFLPTEKIPKS